MTEITYKVGIRGFSDQLEARIYCDNMDFPYDMIEFSFDGSDDNVATESQVEETSTVDDTEPVLVFQCAAHNQTPIGAANLFAKTYFAEPRLVEWFLADGSGSTFALVDGVATYNLVYKEGVALVSSAVYMIYRNKVS